MNGRGSDGTCWAARLLRAAGGCGCRGVLCRIPSAYEFCWGISRIPEFSGTTEMLPTPRAVAAHASACKLHAWHVPPREAAAHSGPSAPHPSASHGLRTASQVPLSSLPLLPLSKRLVAHRAATAPCHQPSLHLAKPDRPDRPDRRTAVPGLSLPPRGAGSVKKVPARQLRWQGAHISVASLQLFKASANKSRRCDAALEVLAQDAGRQIAQTSFSALSPAATLLHLQHPSRPSADLASGE